MKPCNTNRKRIAWLALEQLDPQEKGDLLLHLEECGPCRAYFREMSRLTGLLSEPKLDSDLEASQDFHRKLLSRLRTADKQIGVRFRAQQGRTPFSNWRVALTGLCMVLLGVIAAVAWLRLTSTPHQVSPKQELVSAQLVSREFEPTISNYKTAANQSFDRFDKLLTQEGSRNLSPTPIYTASALHLVAEAD